LALDSLDGKKVPSIPEIKEKINRYKEILSQKEGISNVKVESDFTNFIFKTGSDSLQFFGNSGSVSIETANVAHRH
jgi:hypothetical protein